MKLRENVRQLFVVSLLVLAHLALAAPTSEVLLDGANLSAVMAQLNDKSWRATLPKTTKIVRVQLPVGRVRLNQPLALHWPGKPTLVLQGVGANVGGTVLNGAVELAMRPLATLPADQWDARLSAAARRQVWVANLQTNLPPSPPRGGAIVPVNGELFFEGAVQPAAAWPNQGYGQLTRPPSATAEDKASFGVQGRFATDWSTEPDLCAFAYWFWDWDARTYAVTPASDGWLRIAGGGSQYGVKAGQRVRIQDALSELDAPGEWYADRTKKLLYFWPPMQPASGDTLTVEWSMAEGLLQIADSANVTIRGIAFEATRGDAVVVSNSDNVALEQVAIRNTGNRAFVVQGGHDSGIRNSVVEHAGEGGVSLTGGDRTTLSPAGHFVENSVIRNFSRLAKTYRPAVALDGVGQRVQGNQISEASYSAIMFQGNDHRIADNEIFNVVNETSDAGAIYTGRDFTARGTVIEGNFLHDIRAPDKGREVKGVYLDDQASGITVRSNVFARVQQPVFIGGGRDNVVDGNVFYQSSPGIHLDARGLNWQRAATMNPKDTLQTRLDAVPFQSAVWAQRYPNLPNIRGDNIGAPKYNLARGNVVVGGKAFSVAKEATAGIELGGTQEQDEDVFAMPMPTGGRKQVKDFVLKLMVK